MKKIKIYLCMVVMIIFVVGITMFINKEEYSYYLVLGDYISNKQVLNNEQITSFSSLVGEYLKEEKVVNEVSSGYIKNNMTSKKLLEMIESDSYKINDSSLVDLIKKSKYISISLGINDIINQVKYDSYKNEIVYDKDVIDSKIQIFKHNYHQVLQEIQDINKDSKVILVGCYNLYGDNQISNLLNNAIKEVASDFEAIYVDVSDINDKYMYQDNELYLTSFGQEIISKKVIGLINKQA